MKLKIIKVGKEKKKAKSLKRSQMKKYGWEQWISYDMGLQRYRVLQLYTASWRLGGLTSFSTQSSW